MKHAPLYDAHCHLADPRLAAYQTDIEQALQSVHLKHCIVNGTSPSDWAAVLEYANQHTYALPAVGLHPWQVNSAPDDWRTRFLAALDAGVRIVGEIGLDQWINEHDIQAQQAAFRWQLAEAASRNLPCSIHCLKAIGPLMETVRSVDLPARGIHLHALNVSVDAARELIDRGTYFSFNAGQLKPKAKHIYDLICAIPADRILVETDAPDFLPRAEHRTYALPDPTLNHPADIQSSYAAIAEIRGLSVETLAITVENNFKRYFMS